MARNSSVEASADLLVRKVDHYISGHSLEYPPNKSFRDFLKRLTEHGGSVRIASAFLVFYSFVDPKWDYRSVPTGIRGKYGDKKLGSALNDRFITYHKSVTAFGENLGWKGNVQNVNLANDPRFRDLVALLESLDDNERVHWLEWIAQAIANTQKLPQALPPLSPSYMTYARCLNLAMDLISIQSEGHIQQFLVAAILSVHRKKSNVEIRTHHPHASDKFDGTAGDIEEFSGDLLVGAYEVTVRDDWKNRIPDLRSKMQTASLSKYVLIGGGVSDDQNIYVPEQLLQTSSSWNFDLAVVDICDFMRVFCSELTSEEFVEAINLTHRYLSTPELCGRQDFIEKFSNAVERWMDI